jgi:hypothetical protein
MNHRQRNLLIGGGIILLVVSVILYFTLFQPPASSPSQPPAPSQPPSVPDYVPYPDVPPSEEPPLGEFDVPPGDIPPVPPPLKSRGEECEISSECNENLTCFNGVCQSFKREGEDCESNENCIEGGKCHFERTKSKLGKCTLKKEAGESCVRRSDCIPYIDCKEGGGCTVLACDGGKCAPVKISLLYGQCTRNEQCYPNGKCLNGKCYPNYALGEKCIYDQDCGAYPNTYCHPTLKKCYSRPSYI